jgi:hopanoid biosynthesis associated RND transporter like protein HpnN
MNLDNRLRRLLEAWVDLMTRRAGLVAALGLAGTLALGYYTATHLGINTSNTDLISSQVGWRQDHIAYEKAYPVYRNNLVVVIDAATPGLADEATDTLAAAMHGQPHLFPKVYVPGGGKFFARNGLLYLKPDELTALSQRLNRIQPLLGRLSADPTLPTFFSLLNDAMAPNANNNFDLKPIFNQLTGAFNASRHRRFFRLSWRKLMGGANQPGMGTRRLVIVQPKLNYGALLAGEKPMRRIHQLAAAHHLDPAHGVRVRETGDVALSNQELASVLDGAVWQAVLSLVLVGVVLYLGLRSLRLMAAAVATLISGLVGTAAFATAAFGELNLLSVAFAVLYIGLGISYAIHLCLRYREAAREGVATRGALRLAAGDVGLSLLLCAITTAVGFFAFIPTAYSGVAELGLISGVGMFISLVVSLTLLPALIMLLAARPPRARSVLEAGRGPFIGARAQRAIWVLAIVVAVACASALPDLRFDSNTLDMQNQHTEAVATYRDLLANSDRSPLTVVATRPTLAGAKQLANRLAAQPEIARAMTIADYVPSRQKAKLAKIGTMALTLALSAPNMAKHASTAQRRAAIASFAKALSAYRRQPGHDAATRAAAARLARALGVWRRWFKQQPPKAQKKILSRLHDTLLAGFPYQIHALMQSLHARRITLSNLPAALRRHWIGRDGSYRVEAFARGDLQNTAALKAFVASAKAVDSHITGPPVLELAAGRTVAHAFRNAFIYAAVFITLFLLLLLRSIVDTLRVLAPLVLSGLILAVASVGLDIPFNFTNVIALPLLLGVGVDSGIHVVRRLRTPHLHHEPGPFLSTSTARAVILASLTTIAGFASLLVSNYPGTVSLGQFLTIGMGALLLTTLVIVPSLFTIKGRG